MSKKLNLFWVGYYYFFFILGLAQASAFFAIESTSHFYYSILYSFNSIFALEYFYNVMQILLTLLHLFPLYFFITNKRAKNQDYYKILFALRLLFDTIGHSWEMNYLASVFQLSPKLCYSLMAGIVFLYLPSYYACYIYAFSKNKDADTYNIRSASL